MNNVKPVLEIPRIVTLSDLQPNSIRTVQDLRRLYEERMKPLLIQHAGVTVPRGTIDRRQMSMHQNILGPVLSNISSAHFHIHDAVLLVSQEGNGTNTTLANDGDVAQATTDVLLEMRASDSLHRTFWTQDDAATMSITEVVEALEELRDSKPAALNEPLRSLERFETLRGAMQSMDRHLYRNADLGRVKQGYAFVRAVQERVREKSSHILWPECDAAAIKKHAIHGRDVTQKSERQQGAGLLWVDGI